MSRFISLKRLKWSRHKLFCWLITNVWKHFKGVSFIQKTFCFRKKSMFDISRFGWLHFPATSFSLNSILKFLHSDLTNCNWSFQLHQNLFKWLRFVPNFKRFSHVGMIVPNLKFSNSYISNNTFQVIYFQLKFLNLHISNYTFQLNVRIKSYEVWSSTLGMKIEIQ